MDPWKSKLLAYLHDPPQKPVGIRDHERQRASFLNRFGLSEEDLRNFDRRADWQAAAADRFLFPDPSKSGLRVDWKESWLEFRHPLGGGILKPGAFPPTAAQLETELTRALDAAAVAETEDWQRRFVVGWRLWPELAAREKNGHFAYLVADTRIPDHTLWHHNSLAAAFSGCEGKPAFLMFQIGPVQEFIAQARKTQDLWSGSFLLSFLVAQAMLAIADKGLVDGREVPGLGPDAIVFPQLRGLPLADLHWWRRGFLGPNQKLRASHPNELLTPNLPNRFLALVPASRGEELARMAETAVRETWRDICRAVKQSIQQRIRAGFEGWDKHWETQVSRFPVVDWVVHSWADTASAIELAKQNVPPLQGGWDDHPLNHALRWAEECIPMHEREGFGPRSNSGFAWALHFAAADWKFAARKNARSFAPWREPGPLEPDGVPKDHLDGRSEVLGGPQHEESWTKLQEVFPGRFKGSQRYGAITVVKRLWPDEYLREKLDLDRAKPVFEPVDEIARIDEAIDAADGEAEKYYAVLAMDADDMGQWVGGCKAAPLMNSLAQPAQEYFLRHWSNDGPGLPPAKEVRRPLSPGYHAALSEALANFSLYCAGPIVREFGGQLIYAGGDDVLAMVPAGAALDCAQALQIAFRGLNPADPKVRSSLRATEALQRLFDYSSHTDGFILLGTHAGRGEHLKPNWPLMVVGPRATVSVGIAIGHVHAPMQDTIQAAREAEAAAKQITGKGAFCLSILKRSGESSQLIARWESGVASVWDELLDGVHDQSGRFAYRYLELVGALLAATGPTGGNRWVSQWTAGLVEAAEAELRYVLRRQAGQSPPKAEENARRWIRQLVGDPEQPALHPRGFVHFWTAWAFVNRISRNAAAS